jgi:hypothetical protein
MKELKDWFKRHDTIAGLSLFLIIAAAVITPLWFVYEEYVTLEYSLVVKSPTEEQVLALYEYSSDENRFWVNGIEKIYGDNSLVEVKVQVRKSEREFKIDEVMNSLGISDYAIGQAAKSD